VRITISAPVIFSAMARSPLRRVMAQVRALLWNGEGYIGLKMRGQPLMINK
jgi:hypothetical protein